MRKTMILHTLVGVYNGGPLPKIHNFAVHCAAIPSLDEMSHSDFRMRVPMKKPLVQVQLATTRKHDDTLREEPAREQQDQISEDVGHQATNFQEQNRPDVTFH